MNYFSRLTLFKLLFFVSIGIHSIAQGMTQLQESPCNGKVEYCSRPYNELTFAMAHNAQSYKSNWIFTGLPSNIHNQSRSITQQLKDGIRAMKMPLHGYRGEAFVCHGIKIETKKALEQKVCSRLGWFGGACTRMLNHVNPCSIDPSTVKLSEILSTLKGFLDQNPKEVITLLLEDQLGDFIKLNTILNESELRLYLYHHKQHKNVWPTLGEMIQENARLVVFVSHPTMGKDLALDDFENLMNFSSYVWSSPYHYRNVKALGRDLESLNDLEIENAFQSLQLDNRLTLIQHFVTPFIGGSQKGANLANEATFLKQRVQRYMRLTHKKPNFISVDFYQFPENKPGIFQIVEELNHED